MNYIGYKELDKLLYKLPQLRAKVQNLRIEIAKLQTEGMDEELQDVILYSLFIGNHEYSDRVQCSTVPGDKLLKAIERKDRIVEELYPQDLADMCIVLADAVNKIEIALECLDDQESEVVQLKYFHGKEFKEISEVMFLKPDWLGQIKKMAVEKMANALHMEPEQYEFCIKYVK